ncbi:MAG TPA: outer membrane protein transport protein [Kofleriaceae bacterium]|nr:outer membrane protein transport protein [Kofleriaceae bacterium]
MGSTRLAALAAGLTFAYGSSARAGGLFMPGIGPSAVARAGAWIATADDPTALATNPAGLDQGWGTQVYIGSTFLDYSMTFARAGVYEMEPGENHPWTGTPYAPVTDKARPPIGFGSYQALPAIAVSTDAGLHIKGLRFAAGVFVPTAYPERDMQGDYVFDDPNTPPPPTRYDVVKQSAAIVMPSLGASYHVNDKLSVGARFVWGLADIKATTYTWGFPGNYQESTTKDSLFHLEAKDNFAPAFGLGLLYKLNDSFTVGAQWSSELDVHAVGTGSAKTSANLIPATVILPSETVKCEAGGTPDSIKGCINIALPMSAGVGGRWLMRDDAGNVKGDLEADVQWEHWSAEPVSNYHVIVDARVADPGTQATIFNLKESIIRHGLQDTVSVRLGGSREVVENVLVRAGVAYDTKAAKDWWERADFDGAARFTFAGGAGYKAGKIKIDAGFGYVYEGGSRTMGTNPPCNPDSTMPSCGDQSPNPIDQRKQPDPIQPLADPNNAALNYQSPINSGTITSHYLFFLLAANYQF